MFAVTERLLLRPGWPEDAPALARAIGNQAVARMLSRVPWPYRIDHAEEWLALPSEPLRPRFLIFRRDTAELVGGLGFTGADEPELGYWIAQPCWGQGFGTEAAKAAVAIADHSLRLPCLAARHAVDNPASARILARSGFLPLGELTELRSAARGDAMVVRSLVRPRFASASERLAA